ncbi:MAG: ABC transporter permease subunit [Phycisphaerae bacterium]|nr:ABC transporter permease subunit [Phycisphaerae bacterium]
MFLTLLRKDWRLAKPAFLLMVVLFFVPASVGVAVTGYARIFEDKVPLLRFSNDDFADLLSLLVGGGWLCIFVGPAVAACQFARERRERTSDFLGALPVSRGRIIRSKALTTACMLAFPLLLCFLASISASTSNHNPFDGRTQALSMFGLLSAIFLGVCGLGWLFSCILSSEILATTAALLVSATLAFKIYLVFQVVPSLKALSPMQRELTLTWTIAVLFACFAIVGFIAGTIIASVRRTL